MATTSSDSKNSWTRLIAAYRSSGQSKVAFCQDHGLKVHQLSYHIKMQNRKTPAKGGGFARVAVPLADIGTTRPEKIMAKLSLKNGFTVDFTTDTDPAWAARLISQLGGFL